MTTFTFGEPIVRRLPFLTKSGRIFFITPNGKTSFLYTKHSISFPNNLSQLLADLEKGEIVRIWFDIGLVGHIEIFLNKDCNLEGIFSSNDKKTTEEFQKVLKTN